MKALTRVNADIEQAENKVLILKGEILALEEDKEVRREERRIKEALEDLRKHQKGYHGFFYELIHPIQQKYEIAIKVALQTALKLLVVESVDVAHKVDEYLTEKGLNLECLILDKIPPESISSSIHSKRKKLEGRGHMIVDVVDCDKDIKGLENALKYFCGEKVVCLENKEGYDNTIYLSNKGFKRVITLDGTSLNNGMFESGHHSNIFDKALGSVKQDKVIKEKRTALSKAMESLVDLKLEKTSIEDAINKCKTDMITKETQIRLLKENVNLMSDRDKEKRETAESMKKEILTVENELKTLLTERKELNKQVNAIQKEISEIESVEFSDFMKKAKVKSLVEFEGTNIKEFEENARLKQAYLDNLARVKHQIDQLGIEQCTKAIEMLKGEQNQITTKQEELEKELADLLAEMDSKVTDKNAAEREFNDFKKKKDKDEINMKKDEEELNLYKRRLQELEKTLQETKYLIKSKYIALLKKQVLDEKLTDKKAESLNNKLDLSLEIDKFVSKVKPFDIDYEILDIEVDKATQRTVTDYIEKLERLLKEKEKAIEDYERVSLLEPECKKEIKNLSERMKELKEDYEKEGEEGKSSSERLKEVKRLRSESINQLLQVLNDKLSPIYQNLTKKDEYIFGTAHLMIEDKLHPFNGTINFIPNPPGKRSIYDIQQLSSGEKSMAVLSFVFALIKYCHLPFLILDEADAHLDDSHILRIVEYICKHLNKQ